jgi:ABC-type sulfate/molybdate transport systems ATPase subunit
LASQNTLNDVPGRSAAVSASAWRSRALAAEPDLLLLDEHLSALDQPTREELRGVLRDLLSGLGIPAVHVTQDRDEALSLANYIAIIVNGQLRQTQSAHEITSRPADADVAGLLGWSDSPAHPNEPTSAPDRTSLHVLPAELWRLRAHPRRYFPTASGSATMRIPAVHASARTTK